MFLAILIFEVTDKIPSVAYMYVSGLMLALTVFGATYFHRQIGMMTLFFVGFICAQDIETPDIVREIIRENGENYLKHWDFSCRMTFVLSIILFFAAIILKRRRKRKTELKNK